MNIIVCGGTYVKQTFAHPKLRILGTLEMIPHQIIGEQPMCYKIHLEVSRNNIASHKTVDIVLEPMKIDNHRPVVARERFEDLGIDITITFQLCEIRCGGDVPVFFHGTGYIGGYPLADMAFASPIFFEVHAEVTSLPETQGLSDEEFNQLESIACNVQQLVDSIGYKSGENNSRFTNDTTKICDLLLSIAQHTQHMKDCESKDNE